ncbi:MAG: class I SAM-dependent methyltransferase [Candidatus Latescibacterota bacterium]|nr:MAG: class I SAM-dependent methyltransferase [Candidatus Latescibacterota bacterium]
MTPPRGLSRYIGEGDFKAVGEKYVEYLITLGGLKKEDKILDVGCGIGRMAVPLTAYLEEDGSYDGFDIVPEGIKWCRENITSRFPNFRFLVADIYNKQYLPTGKYSAADYKFPYESNRFDFVFLGSVFTHMLPKDMANYLSEIVRVLRIGGTIFVTFFLLNDESRRLIADGSSSFDFRVELDGCWSIDEQVPERAVAYEEDHIRTLFEKQNLSIVEPIRFGSWSGREKFTDVQDIVVAKRET